MGMIETAYDDPPSARLRALLKLQEEDAWLGETLRQSAEGARVAPGADVTAGSQSAPLRWVRGEDGVMRHKGRIYLPLNGGMRARTVRAHHDDPLAGHFGVKRTLELIQRKYYWPGMGAQVRDYVATCTTCARVKATRHKPYGELEPLPTPKGPWQDVTMDFITGLPPSGRKGEAFDAILVVVDRFTKMARYIPCRKSIDSAGLADLLIDNIVARYGVPLSIVSDRGTVFTAQFWSNVCYHAKIKRRLSTAFHPQTDGQTERQNQTLEQYLRSFVNYQQDDWAQWLPMAEFAYNNSVHSATGYSPFFAYTGCNPRLEVDLSSPPREVPAVRQRFEDLEEIRTQMTTRLESARKTQRRYANLRTKPRIYAPGDMVWLAGRHIHTIRPCKKLDYKFYGPFKILDAVGPQAYRLDLTGHLHGIHPVFHVSLLEPVRRREGEDLPPPSFETIDGQEETEIKAIRDSKIAYRRLYYLVEWLGFTEAHNEWLPAEELRNATDAVAQYHESHPDAPGPKQAEEARKEGEGRPRGRPRKTFKISEIAGKPYRAAATTAASGAKRSRGRPRKHPQGAHEHNHPSPAGPTNQPRWNLVQRRW